MVQASEQIFISYAHEDVTFAEALANALQARGRSVWWDFSMVAGQHFRAEISSKIDRAKILVVVWSPSSVSSGFVLDEATRALEQNKLVPLSIAGAFPPLGFGHVHTLPVASVDRDIERILAAVDRGAAIAGTEPAPEAPPAEGAVPRVARQFTSHFTAHTPPVEAPKSRAVGWSRWLAVVGCLLLAAGGAAYSFFDRFRFDHTYNCYRFGCEWNYATFRSEPMRLQFAYPQKQLSVDTTKEHMQRLPMFNHKGEVEVEISRSPLPAHHNPIEGSADEQTRLAAAGYVISYVAPRINPAQAKWYVLSGVAPDMRHFYYRRWYTAGDVVSMEFHYRPEFKTVYDSIIPDMTIRGIEIRDPM